MTTPTRTHTFTWHDPMIGAQAAMTMSGMAYLTAMFNGEIPQPPISAIMNLAGSELEPGRAVFTGMPAEYMYNPIGMVHGGFAATICDAAMGCAIHSTLPAGTGYSTLELSINYVRPITKDTGLMTCEGKVIHAGRRVATADCRLVDASGKLYAHGTTTCAIFGPDAGA